MGAENTPNICVIGGGLSGLCMAIKIKSELKLNSFTVYETCEDLGGVWFRNQYPGCACDLPSHLYSYSFAPKYDWSALFAPQPEIQNYMRSTADTYEVYPNFKFNSSVLSLTWNDKTFKWTVIVKDDKDNTVKTLDYDIVINCTGVLRDPKIPEEFSNFKGKLMHTSNWDHSVSYEGKNVAVVGSGASSIQLVPSIADKVKTLLVFQRDAPTVVPQWLISWMDCAILTWAVANLPFAQKLFRFLFYWMAEMFMLMQERNSKFRYYFQAIVENHRKRQIKNEKLLKQTEIKNKFMEKLPVLSDRYYLTLGKSNVELVSDKIVGVEGNTVKTEAKDYNVDVLILATGFKCQDFFGPMKIFGRSGIDILQQWKSDRPRTYMGICDSLMPNLFSICGPYSSPIHSAVAQMEDQTNWTILAIRLMMKKRASCITATKEAVDEFMNKMDNRVKETMLYKPTCSCFHLNDKGQNTVVWPDYQFRYSLLCRKVDENAFSFQ